MMNPLKAVVPFGVVTLTVRVPGVAAGSIWIVIGILVGVLPVIIVDVTPVPLNVTLVVPSRFRPLIVPAIVVLGTPTAGNTDVIVGMSLGLIKKSENAPESAYAVATFTVREPIVAVIGIVIVIGRPVSVPPAAITAVTPVPLNATADTPLRFDPWIVADTVVPAVPDDGVIPVMIGVAGVMKKEPKGAEVPFGVVTVNVLEPMEAVGIVVIVIGKAVSEPPAAMLAVTPFPLKITAVAPLRCNPLIVADTIVPCTADEGPIDVTLGTVV